jgi:hypothetical protein
MTLTNLLEKIKRDQSEARRMWVERMPYDIETFETAATNDQYEIELNDWWPVIEADKTHHESLLKALEIAIEKLKLIQQKSIFVCENGWRDEHFLNVEISEQAIAEIEAVLKGCGDV